MTFNARDQRRSPRGRQQRALRESHDRPKLVAALLAGGIFLLTGGGALIALHPAASDATKDGKSTAANPRAADLAAELRALDKAQGSRGVLHRGNNAATGSLAVQHRSDFPSALPATAAGVGGSILPPRVSVESDKPVITYVVKRGDTLSGIAIWFKLHGYGQLYAANKAVIGSNPNVIHPGERIAISSAGIETQSSAHGYIRRGT